MPDPAADRADFDASAGSCAGLEVRPVDEPICDDSDRCGRAGWDEAVPASRMPADGSRSRLQEESGNGNAADPAEADGPVRGGDGSPLPGWRSPCISAGLCGPGPRRRPRRSTPACRRCRGAWDRRWGRRPGRGTRRWGRRPARGAVPRGPTCPAPGSWAAAPGPTRPRASPPRSRRRAAARARPPCRCRSRPPSPSRSAPTTSPFAGTLGPPLHRGRRAARRPDARPGHRRHARSATWTSARSSSRSPWPAPTSSRRACGPTPSSTRTGSSCQYQRGEFNRSRPGGPQQFDTNITYPLDISQKRRARTVVADPRPEGARGPVPGRRPQPDRRRLRRLRHGPERPPDAAIRRRERQGAGGPPGPDRAALPGRAASTQLELDRVENQLRVARARPDRCRGRLSQGEARPGIVHEPARSRRRRSWRSAARSTSSRRRCRPSRSCGRSPWPNAPISSPSASASRAPMPTSGWPGPTPTATSMSSGSPIPSRTTAPTGSRAPRPGRWA